MYKTKTCFIKQCLKTFCFENVVTNCQLIEELDSLVLNI